MMEHKEFQKKLKEVAPKTTLSWDQHFKKKSKKRKVFLLIGLILFLVWLTVHNAKKQYAAELMNVIVAREEIQKGTQIQTNDLSFEQFSRSQLPDNYYSDADDLTSLYAVQIIPQHSIITAQDVKRFIQNDSLAVELGEGEMAFTIDGMWLESKIPQLTKGDHISVLVSNPKRGIDDTVFVVESTEIIDFIRGDKSSSSNYITIKVTADESRNLLYAKSQNLVIAIVLTQ